MLRFHCWKSWRVLTQRLTYTRGSFDWALGQSLAELRERAEMSQQQLAAKGFESRSYISLVERGISSPTLRSLRAMLGVLGVSIQELLERVEDWMDHVGGRRSAGAGRRQSVMVLSQRTR